MNLKSLFKGIALTCFAVVMSIPAQAQTTFTSYTEDGSVLSYTIVDAEKKYVSCGRPVSCTSIVTVPGKVTYNGEQYRVTSMAYQAFYFPYTPASSIMMLTLSEGIDTIYAEAFMNMSSLQKVNLPSTLKVMEFGAFRGCSSLQELILPEGFTEFALYDYSNKGNALYGWYTYGCSSLKKIYIPSTVTKWNIGSSAFGAVNALEEVELGQLTDIPDYLFNYASSGNEALTTLTIPSTVKSIGVQAFNMFKALNKVICLAETPPALAAINAFNSAATGGTLVVPTGSKEAYANDATWKFFSNIEEADMKLPTIADATLRNYVWTHWDTDNSQYFTDDEIAAATTLNFNWTTGNKIADLSGLDFFTALNTISLNNHSITAADLSALTKVTSFSATGQTAAVKGVKLGEGKYGVEVNGAVDAARISNVKVNGTAVSNISVMGNSSGKYLLLPSLNMGENTITYDYDPALPGVPSARINVALTATLSNNDYPLSDVTVPDTLFRQYISSKYDTDGNGYLDTAELTAIAAVTQLGATTASAPFSSAKTTVQNSGYVADLTGIELFTGLQNLYLSGAPISKLDLSKNKAMVNLDLRGCQNLKQLTLGETPTSTTAGFIKVYNCNVLEDLDLSPWHHKVTVWWGTTATAGATTATSCKSLKRFVFPANIANTTFNISYCTALEEMDASHNTVASTITTMYLTNLHALRAFNLDSNSKVKASVKTVYGMTSLESLEEVDLSNATTLNRADIIKCPKLKKVVARNCTGTTNNFILQANDCPELEEVDAEGSTALYNCYVYNDPKLKNLNVKGCPKLNILRAYNAATAPGVLESLDLNDNVNITELRVDLQPKLTTLDVSKMTKLKTFYAYGNANYPGSLQTLTMGNNTALTNLQLHFQPKLAALDVSGCTALATLYCYGNADVPSSLSAIDLANNTALTNLRLQFNPNLTSLDITNNTKITYINLRQANISSLDVSHQPDLASLLVAETKMKTIDVSNNTKLTSFTIFGSPVEQLDLSKNTALTSLQAYNCELRELDLTNNTALKTLKVYGNHMYCADFSKQTEVVSANFNAGLLHDTDDTSSSQTDSVTVVDLNGATGIAVPAAMDASKVKNLTMGETTIATPTIKTVDGTPYLVVENGAYSASEWKDGATVVYDYMTGCTQDTVMMNVQLFVRPVEVAPETAVDLFVSPLGKADDGKYYASLYYGEQALIVPTGVNAYTYRVVDGELAVSRTYAPGEVIPAGQGVIICAEGSTTFTFEPATTAGTADVNSMLFGSDEEKTDSESGYVYYMLSTPPANTNFGIGFWWQTEGGRSITNGAHKAYLKVPEAQAASIKGFNFGGNTTGITSINNEQLTIDNSAWYTLDGQKLQAAPTQKGVYLRNGKKTVIK